MKTLLCATLAVLLVAAVTAQSSQQTDDASSIQGLIEKINDVVSSLGGFEGTINKLGYITKLVEKAYTDKGIGGWMARNLIKLELSQLKEKALNSEKDMINHLLDQLESKTGLKSYSEDPAESYILSETVKNAIGFIRQNIQQILGEISKAQKEHDEAAGKISKDALGKITERLNGLKDKLRGLSKRLLDKLTGRDKTADVYGADGGIRYQEIEVASDSYIVSEMIRVAAQQLRERIFKYVEQIGEAKREAQKAFGKSKEQALEHLEKLKGLLRKSLADLKDTLLGRKSNQELEKEIKEDDTAEAIYAVQTLSADNYILDGVVKELIGQLRVKILEVIEQLGKAKREAERAAGDAKSAAKDQLAKLREQLKKLTGDLKDAILGRKTKKELEEDLREDNTAESTYAVQTISADNYILDGVVKELIGQLRVKILEVIEQLGKAKREAERAAGDAKSAAKDQLTKLREQLKKLTGDLKDAILGRKTKEELEEDLKENQTYSVQLMSSESYFLNKELIGKLRERIQVITEELEKAAEEALKATGKAREASKERLAKLRDILTRLTKGLMNALIGRTSADELEKELNEDTVDVETYALNSRAKELLRKIRSKIIQALEALGNARGQDRLALVREHIKKLNQLWKDVLLGRRNTAEVEKELDEDNTVYAVQPSDDESYILNKELIEKFRERVQRITEELKKAGEEALKATGKAKDAAKERLSKLREELTRLTKGLMDALLGRKTADELEKVVNEDETVYAESYISKDELIAKIRERIQQLNAQLWDANDELLRATAEGRAAAREHFNELQERLVQLRKNLLSFIMGRKSVDEVKKDLEESF